MTEFVVTTRASHTFPQDTWGTEHGRFKTKAEADAFADELWTSIETDLTLLDIRELWTDENGEVHEI